MPTPTKLSPEVTKTICDAVVRGLPKRHAAALAGISRETLYTWERDGQAALTRRDAGEEITPHEQELAAFAIAYDRAEAERIGKLIGEMETTDSGAVVSARQWLLDRGFTREFGAQSKVALTGGDGGAIQHKHDVNSDELLARLEALAARNSGSDEPG
jgi:hypothetical protein